MGQELMRTNGSSRAITKVERATAQEKAAIVAEVQLAGARVDGAVALADHTIEQLVQLERSRQQMVQGDPVANALTVDIIRTAMAQVNKVQRRLFDNDFDL